MLKIPSSNVSEYITSLFKTNNSVYNYNTSSINHLCKLKNNSNTKAIYISKKNIKFYCFQK